jgi:4-aminobutyrate aminotransferase and related aminotransferases
MKEQLNEKHLMVSGIEIGVCGDYSIRLRPALIFGPKHAEIFLSAFQSILKEKSS